MARMASGIRNPGRRNALAHLPTLAAAAAAPMARAQSARWPEKTVRIIVPCAPGGGTDQVYANFFTESGTACWPRPARPIPWRPGSTPP